MRDFRNRANQYLSFYQKFPPGIFLRQKKRNHVFHTISLFDTLERR